MFVSRCQLTSFLYTTGRSVLLFFLSCSGSKRNTPPQSPQELPVICDFKQKRDGCLGKVIQIHGSVPKMIYNHPMINTPLGPDSIQSYLEIEDQQLIILSEEQWNCSGKVEITGILKEIDMGGPEGTRNSYRNYYISQSTINCL